MVKYGLTSKFQVLNKIFSKKKSPDFIFYWSRTDKAPIYQAIKWRFYINFIFELDQFHVNLTREFE